MTQYRIYSALVVSTLGMSGIANAGNPFVSYDFASKVTPLLIVVIEWIQRSYLDGDIKKDGYLSREHEMELNSLSSPYKTLYIDFVNSFSKMYRDWCFDRNIPVLPPLQSSLVLRVFATIFFDSSTQHRLLVNLNFRMLFCSFTVNSCDVS